jgi:hypothetical protein
MRTGRRDRDSPLRHLLAADIGEVFVVVRELLEEFVETRGRRLDVQFAGEKRDGLCEAVDGEDGPSQVVELTRRPSLPSVS